MVCLKRALPILAACFASLAIASGAPAVGPCPSDFSWLGNVARWTQEGHDPRDLETLNSFVKRGYISEADAIKVVDENDTMLLDHIFDLKGFEKKTVSRADANRVHDAFTKIEHGELLGKPKLIEAPHPTRGPQRRSHVLVQKAEATEKEGNSSLVLLDPKSKSSVGFVEYEYDARKATLSIDWIGMYKPERGQGYSDLLFRQILAAHPKAKKIVATLGGDNARIYDAAIAEGKIPNVAITLTPLYKSQTKLGFIIVKIGQDEHGMTQLIAERP